MKERADGNDQVKEPRIPAWVKIIRRLSGGETRNVTQLISEFRFSRGSIYGELNKLVDWGIIERISHRQPHAYRITRRGIDVWRKFGDSVTLQDVDQSVKPKKKSERKQKQTWVRLYELMVDNEERDVSEIVAKLEIHKASVYKDTRYLCKVEVLRERWTGALPHARKKHFRITEQGLRTWNAYEGKITREILGPE